VAKYLCSILGGKVPFSMNQSHLEELEEVLTTPGNLWEVDCLSIVLN
jgi:hypothetical protein